MGGALGWFGGDTLAVLNVAVVAVAVIAVGAAASLERIREVLDTDSGVRDRPHARKVILKDVSFDIAPGLVAAFVGPTGGANPQSSTWWRDSTTRCRARFQSTARADVIFVVKDHAKSTIEISSFASTGPSLRLR